MESPCWRRLQACCLSALLFSLPVLACSCRPSCAPVDTPPEGAFRNADGNTGAFSGAGPSQSRFSGAEDSEDRCLLETLDGRFVVRVLAERCPDLGVGLRENVALAILEEAAAAGFDPMLVLGLIQVESRFDPMARSSAGARGLVQLQAPTARHQAAEEGIALTEEDVTMDPEWQVRLGVRYLAGLQKRFRQMELALIAYNAGPTKLQRLLSSAGGRRKPSLAPYQGYPKAVLRQQALFEADRAAFAEQLGSSAFRTGCGAAEAPPDG